MLRNKANSKLLVIWLLPIVILSLSFLLELGGDDVRANLRYQFNLFDRSEFWRLLTGHFVHLGWSHFFLNGVGFALVWSLFGKSTNLLRWTFIFIACCIGISLCFYYFDKNLDWYVGLSGVLHGIIMAGLCMSLYADYAQGNKRNNADLILLVGVVLKLVYEQSVGAVPLTASSSGGPVVVNAHFYGAIIGTICASIYILKDYHFSKK